MPPKHTASHFFNIKIESEFSECALEHRQRTRDACDLVLKIQGLKEELTPQKGILFQISLEE